MRRCSVRPYEGSGGYIFVSYCYLDKLRIFPIIERLARDGYRVWYDEGISPQSGNAEVIADRISRCTLCLTFVTDNALNSHHYRREINFAILKKKPLISVPIEDIELSPGMNRQMESALVIDKSKMDDDAFYFELYRSALLEDTLGAEDETLYETVDPYDETDEVYADPRSFSDMWFSDPDDNAHYTGRRVNATYTPDPLTIDRLTQESAATPMKKVNMVSDDYYLPPSPDADPDKKRSAVRKRLIAAIALLVLTVAAAAAVVGFALNRSDDNARDKAGVATADSVSTADSVGASHDEPTVQND